MTLSPRTAHPDPATDRVPFRNGTEPLVQMADLTLAHGSHIAVTGAHLTVLPHQIVAFVGPNGGGKTTLLKAILGLVPARSGTLRVLGQQPRIGLPGLGYVPQSGRIDPEFPLSVREVVRTGTLARTLRRDRTAGTAVTDVLERLGLTHLAPRPIGALSGGQLQRVLIARALVSHPLLLLLDVPTSALDPDARCEIFHLLESLRPTTTMLIASHDTDRVEAHADVIAYVDRRLTLHRDHHHHLSHHHVPTSQEGPPHGSPNPAVQPGHQPHRTGHDRAPRGWW